MSDLSNKTLKEIQEKKIQPKAKWHFLLKNWVIWALFVVSIILGSLSFAVTLFLIMDHDWQLYHYLHQSALSYIAVSLPYGWIIFLAIFILIAYYNFNHTEGGYRYRAYVIVGVSILISVGLGVGGHYLGMGYAVDRAFYSHSLPYQKIVPHRVDRWQMPELGLLAGEIFAIRNQDNIFIITFNGQEWLAAIGQAEMIVPFEIGIGQRVKMIGQQIGNFYFRADLIGPWLPPDPGLFQGNSPPCLRNIPIPYVPGSCFVK